MPQAPRLKPGTDITSLMAGMDVTSLMGGGKPQPTVTPGASPRAATREVSQQLWGTEDPEADAKPAPRSTFDHILNMVRGGAEVPVEVAQSLWSLLSPAATVNSVVRGIIQNSTQQLVKAYDDMKSGTTVGLASVPGDVLGAIPLVGPMGTDITEKVAAGDWDKAVGKVGANVLLAKPSLAMTPVRATVGAAKMLGVAEPIAAAAQRAAESRIVNVMAPQLGRNKLRFGADAAKVAGDVVAEPGMGAASRSGLQQKVETRLEASEAELDRVRAARDADVLYETKPITALLEDKIKELTAPAAEGPGAHAQVDAMGLRPQPGPPKFGTPFRDLSREHKELLREIRTEMEEMPSVRRESAAQETGHAGTQHGIDNFNANEGGFIPQEAGAGVFDRLAGNASTGRSQVIRALRRYEAGEGPMSPIVKRALEVAEERLAEGRSSGLFSDPADVSGPIGQSVLPGSSAKIRAAKIRQAIDEIESLGPAATYEALRKIRQAYGQEAAVKYSPSMTQDFLKVQPVVEGAADVTSVLREALGIFDPPTAKANADYTIWRKASDVLRATEEIERSRPRVGRRMMAQFLSATTGAQAAGAPGVVISALLSPLVDAVATSGLTTKITTARMLSDLSKVLKTGNVEAIGARLTALQKYSRALQVNTMIQATNEGPPQ